MNSAIVRAPRALKLPAFADVPAHDLQKSLASSTSSTSSDDQLLRRWERIALVPPPALHEAGR